MTEKSEVPEKIYRLYRFPHGELAYQEDIKPCTPSEEYIRADLVEPSYGAEKIIRGNGKVQDEYILTSLHDKKVEDFKQLAETYRRILNAKGTKAEEV